MAITPVVRWRNFNLSNLKGILAIYPDLAMEIGRTEANEMLGDRYKKTSYQFACQLGLEDRGVDSLKVQNYLFAFSDEGLEQYLEFWIKTYYAPNPFVTGDEEPVIIYKEIGERILNSEELCINFTDAFNEMGFGGSYDILLNVLVNYGKPFKQRVENGTKYIYIEEGEKDELERTLEKINVEFRIATDYRARSQFFERFSSENFFKFYDIENSLENLTEEQNSSVTLNRVVPRDYNRLLVGAPGTGKSYLLKQESEGVEGTQGYFNTENIERVTFYNNYSYAQFVGAYKPKPSTGGEDQEHYITYEYVPGPFLRLLVRALKDYEQNQENCENYLLIIEEINRANNPAAVFGDVFQLLDRDENGKSEYNISCSEEMKKYLNQEGLEQLTKLYIPPNLYIWATMNSADQGVYPLDSAFQRRWNPEYIDINDNEEKITGQQVYIKGYGVSSWNAFRKSLNNRLRELDVKEDKLIGPFFIKPQDLDSEEDGNFQRLFKSKLIRYLSEDVFKHNRNNHLFREKKSYSQLVTDYDAGQEDMFLGLKKEEFTIETMVSETETVSE
ncbi:AAA family ATPase [Bacillus cereus]|uniref:AAA family ATPase n=1 Tax=Bacillus cereus TaxID=1396 RepID=UPI000994A358|nr:AAA family ATPase [Bacillus cereus]OOZ90804.1 hypothetical protein BHL25_03380 [Bacillus cereus]